MWAMIVKEFRQMRRDRRTLAMMVVMPLLLLIVFGYAASFDVTSIPVRVVGTGAAEVAARLPAPFDVRAVAPAEDRQDAVRALRDGDVPVAVVADPGAITVLLDGSELFTANAARAALARVGGSPRVDVLFNPDLRTSAVMVPGLAGMILLFVGTVITSLGVVRERQSGTLEQLAVMPLRPWDVFVGKIAPYFLVAAVDLTVVVAAGTLLFGVPFHGSLLVLALGALLFLFVTLGTGVLISSVSQNQGQAIQLAIMTLLPQVLLSGLIFPLRSMPLGVRWIGYVLPLTYFTQISRGVMLRGSPLTALWQPFLYLALLGAAVVTFATLRFRAFLLPRGAGRAGRRSAPRTTAGAKP
ncbi:ABC transporter permease [Actinoplanes sp. LDG1-06]|uniref:ABC transporter permease n=1 Tax=Paractinoplanes ovalisporus TaxID=2810368 RepID=A0ABS2AAQ9_9ACTN|nr:ABC transporter permease [Actinoplanes ovalisporus]MBM2616339.1 ABC transporter permease [Actinoplanes ovalisporus]